MNWGVSMEDFAKLSVPWLFQMPGSLTVSLCSFLSLFRSCLVSCSSAEEQTAAPQPSLCVLCV